MPTSAEQLWTFATEEMSQYDLFFCSVCVCDGLTIVGLDLHVLEQVKSLQISEEVMIMSADTSACSAARQRWGFNQTMMNTSVFEKQRKLLEVRTWSNICNLSAAHPLWKSYTCETTPEVRRWSDLQPRSKLAAVTFSTLHCSVCFILSSVTFSLCVNLP